jgi:hypothetical protein
MYQFSDYLPGCDLMNDAVLMAAVISGVLAGRWFLSGYAGKEGVAGRRVDAQTR